MIDANEQQKHFVKESHTSFVDIESRLLSEESVSRKICVCTFWKA